MDESAATVDVIAAPNTQNAAKNPISKQEYSKVDDQMEKYDVSPENAEKSSYDNTPNDDLSTSTSAITTNTTATNNSLADESSEMKNKTTGFAFTVDFSGGKTVDSRKHKEIAERLQHRQQQQQEQRRHRRGVSLSKLDETRKSTTSLNNSDGNQIVDDAGVTTIASKPPFKQRIKTDEPKNVEKCDPQATKVVLRKSRPSSQPTNVCKDSSKRHSWSPRSSLNYDKFPSPQDSNDQVIVNEVPRTVETTGSFQPKSSILQKALESTSLRSASPKPKTPISSKSGKKIVSNQMMTAPLEYIRTSDDEGSIGVVSEAGTYTLEGDNYTEEEKERMSIDKLGKRNFDLSIESKHRHNLPKDYANHPRPDLNIGSKYMQRGSDCGPLLTDSKTPPKTAKVSYLDKIKSRVKNIGDRTFHKNGKASTNEKLMNLQVVRTDESSPIEPDHGVFTSITACGVLNKQQKEANFPVRGNRKKSLSKYQIDSSEFVQPKMDEKLMTSYTDYEKAKHNEYKLKIFSTVSSYTSSGTTSPPQTDEDNLSVECIDDKPISIKTAPTKNDWIQEWAKNARRRNNLLASSASASPKMQHHSKGASRAKQLQGQSGDRMSQSYDVAYFKYQTEEFGDDVIEDSSDECAAHLSRMMGRNANTKPDQKVTSNNVLRPPISPTKIPSPMHTQLRARSSSANRSFRNSNADLDNLDTEMYLEKTAAAISSLQKIHRKNNSPQNPLSPVMKRVPNEFSSAGRSNYDKSMNLRSIHKRNLSLDVTQNNKNHNEFYDSDEHFNGLDKRHTRHNSYENNQIQLPSPKHTGIDHTMLSSQQRAALLEQQRMLNKYFNGTDDHARRSSVGVMENTNESPIRRSSSFCNKNKSVPYKATTPTASKKVTNRRVTLAGNSSLQKSASSSSFRKLASAGSGSYPQNYDAAEHESYHINGEDNLHTTRDELLYSPDGSSDTNSVTGGSSKYGSDRQASSIDPPISHTRYNKAFLMRMEQNKQIASGNKGVIACPNTPELPRRATTQRSSFRDPTSMPRDSSLSRMKQDLPNLQTTKKSLTQASSKDSSSSTSSAKQRVLPKYMDISKYKPVQGQNFLKRDESKSTLVNRNEIRKSPSAIGLSKADPMRVSGRVKSAGAKPSTPISTKDTKAREVELAMWRRRATYDPMKAAAEGRKKQQEEAKKNSQQPSKFADS